MNNFNLILVPYDANLDLLSKLSPCFGMQEVCDSLYTVWKSSGGNNFLWNCIIAQPMTCYRIGTETTF